MVEPERLVLRAGPQRSLDQLKLLQTCQLFELDIIPVPFLPSSKNFSLVWWSASVSLRSLMISLLRLCHAEKFDRFELIILVVYSNSGFVKLVFKPLD